MTSELPFANSADIISFTRDQREELATQVNSAYLGLSLVLVLLDKLAGQDIGSSTLELARMAEAEALRSRGETATAYRALSGNLRTTYRENLVY